jgi:hypothetical protein
MTYVKRSRDMSDTFRQDTALDVFTEEFDLSGLRPEPFQKTSVEARKWLELKAREIGQIDSRHLFYDSERIIYDHKKILPGKMYLFRYNPLNKATLAYYDILPLVFPVEKYRDGFLGINFHYLPIQLRLLLLDRLKPFHINAEKMDQTTRLRLSYKLLTSFARLNIVQPTLHKYLYGRFRSRMLQILPDDWEAAVALPCERFVGENKNIVYRNSQRSVKKW